MSAEISEAHADIRALKSLITTGTPVTWPVLNAVWRWFLDVEIVLPLQDMALSGKDHARLAREIVNDLDEAFTRLDAYVAANPDADMAENADVNELNSLWRELASLYAGMLNDSVNPVPEEMREHVIANAIPMLAHAAGVDLDEAAEQVKSNPVTRMMMRRSGIDPDEALRNFLA